MLLLVLGAALRATVLAGFTSAFLVAGSSAYLDTAPGVSARQLDDLPVLGYQLTVSWTGDSLVWAAVAQHLCGLAIAVAIYSFLLRWGVWRWLAALAAVPTLLDPRVVTGEHIVLPDTVLALLLIVALLVLGWRWPPTTSSALIAGILFGASAVVVSAGAVLLLVGVLIQLLARATWRARLAGAVVLGLGFSLPFVSYLSWQHELARPAAVIRIAGLDGSPSVIWSRVTSGTGAFASDAPRWQLDSYPERSATDRAYYARAGVPVVHTREPFADAAIDYSGVDLPPAWLLLIGPGIGLAAALGVGRAKRSGMQPISALAGVLALAGAGAEMASGMGSWHSLLAVTALSPVAGAIGLTALLRGRRSPSALREQHDEVDEAAQREFDKRYDQPMLAPVTIVIAAYNEGAGLPQVLAQMPTSVCELETSVVVVDDGSTDETASAALGQEGVYVVACEQNRGQGAALRLGYRIARDHGARYVITTDADGQYDVADFPTVLAPLIEGRADFVTGSRRLGHQHTYDRFRRLGVHVFAWSVSALVGQRLTDTSFGLRAMRADLTEVVTLNQPQYQSSELLIGAHSHGYRVLEVPGTMHQRSAGSTKKGRNLVYGTRYARVVFGTWWREGCPRPAPETAPALARPTQPGTKATPRTD